MADPTPDTGDPLVARVLRLEELVRELMSPTGTQRALAVRRLPFQETRVSRSTAFALSGAYVTRTTVTVPVPDDRNNVQILAVGTAAALDQLTGGVTTSYGRILIDGDASGDFPAAKDAGATFVNNVITATHARTFDVTELTSFTVDLQLNGLNGAAYPANANNFAQLAVMASFTNV